MIRNLKALGLALAAMFAMSAVAASAASAQQGQLTSDGPVTLDMEDMAPGENFLEAFGERIECPGSSYTGHKFDTTPHALIPVPATTITVTPHYNQNSCETWEGLPVTVDVPTECDLVFHLGGTITEDLWAITKDIECTIKFTVFAGDAHGFRVCTISVGPQTGLAGAWVWDPSGGDLQLSGTVTEIHAEESGLCGSGTESKAEMGIKTTVEGTNAEGGPTAISITD